MKYKKIKFNLKLNFDRSEIIIRVSIAFKIKMINFMLIYGIFLIRYNSKMFNIDVFRFD